MGLIVVTIKHCVFVLKQPDGIEMLQLTNCYVRKIIF